MPQSLQERHAPTNRCFGCGPANEKGLRIRSFEQGDTVVCDWTPDKHHEAFPNVLNGGICGTLLDCHGNWTAAWHLMQADKLAELPSTVTAEFHVKLKAPTPTGGPVHLTARVVERSGPRVVVEETLEAGGRVTATCRGVFVAVQPGHPAWHRW
jgi:acyl-coenzyme A thioesterase PaaI-like protein